jgi:hypothetical protein
MQTTIITAALVAILALISVTQWPSAARVTEVVSTAEIDQRFAIKFCYRQYSNQMDVNHCLLHYAHLTPGQSR